MLADGGLRPLHRRHRRAVQAERDARLPDDAVDRVGHLDRHAVVDDLLVLQRLVGVAHRRDRDLVGPELIEQVLALDASYRVADERVVGQVLRGAGHGRRGFDPEDAPHHAAVLAPPAGRVHRVDPQAVGALVDARLRIPADLHPRFGFDRRVLPQLRGEREHTLVERCLHPLAPAGDLARVERGEDTLDREVRRRDARQRRVQEDRTFAEAGLLVLHARAGLDEQIDGRAIGGVGVARIAGERAVHERGQLGRHGGVIEIARREVAGREALDEHVGGRRELEDPVPIRGVVEVEHDAALPAVGDDRPDVRPLGIAARWLDLHDIGAVIAERHGRERSREPSGQVDDPQSFQCAWHTEPLHRIAGRVRPIMPGSARGRPRSAGSTAA